MKCPKCGYELTEGHLYCDNCGEEIRMVPDFEPEIEKEMNETLSTLFVELAKEEMPEAEKQKTEKKETIPVSHKKRRGLTIVVFFFVFVLFVFWGINYLYRTYSVSYQMERAREYAGGGNYTQAIAYLEKAHELDEEEADILFLTADYYYIQKQYDEALGALKIIIDEQEKFPHADVESAYDKTISIYKTKDDYQAINELLLGCTDEEIVTTFQRYIAKPPEFSFVEGNYEEVLPLKLSANTSGRIYYTLDGSTPDETSEVYTAPIFLETGTYVVNAYFVNDYGIASDMVSNTYTIDLMVPSAPEVSVYSGDYYEPHMIEVTAPEGCSIYYTTDGRDPTADSIPYTAAIAMPLGNSVYKFIAISQEGVASDITIRTYRLTLNTEITTDMAVSNVIQALVEADILLDANGSLRGMSGRNVYKYNAVVRVDGYGDYYVIYEYYEDATGIATRTERIYGANIQTGEPCRITYDEEGKVVLVDIS